MILSHQELSALWHSVSDEEKPKYACGYSISQAYQVINEPNVYLVYLDGFYHPGSPFFPEAAIDTDVRKVFDWHALLGSPHWKDFEMLTQEVPDVVKAVDK